MKKYVWFLCCLFVLTAVSGSFAQDPLLIGNFEDGSENRGPGDIRWDNWMVNLNSSAVTEPTQAATLDTHSLAFVDEDGGWGETITKPFGEYGGTLEENIYYQALLNPNAVIAVDITALSSEVAEDWASLDLFANAAGW